MDLLAIDGYLLWRLYPNANAVTLDGHDGNGNVTTDHNRFPKTACKNEHGFPSLSSSGPITSQHFVCRLGFDHTLYPLAEILDPGSGMHRRLPSRFVAHQAHSAKSEFGLHGLDRC
jgi:hypothetical protein